MISAILHKKEKEKEGRKEGGRERKRQTETKIHKENTIDFFLIVKILFNYEFNKHKIMKY
jgi:hypothetical protein